MLLRVSIIFKKGGVFVFLMDVNRLHFLAKLQTKNGVKYSFDVYRALSEGVDFELADQGYVHVFNSDFRYDCVDGLVGSLRKGYMGAYKLKSEDGINPVVVFLRKEECERYVKRVGVERSFSFIDFNDEEMSLISKSFSSNVFYEGIDSLVGEVIEDGVLEEIVQVEDLSDGGKRA